MSWIILNAFRLVASSSQLNTLHLCHGFTNLSYFSHTKSKVFSRLYGGKPSVLLTSVNSTI